MFQPSGGNTVKIFGVRLGSQSMKLVQSILVGTKSNSIEGKYLEYSDRNVSYDLIFHF